MLNLLSSTVSIYQSESMPLCRLQALGSGRLSSPRRFLSSFRQAGLAPQIQALLEPRNESVVVQGYSQRPSHSDLKAVGLAGEEREDPARSRFRGRSCTEALLAHVRLAFPPILVCKSLRALWVQIEQHIPTFTLAVYQGQGALVRHGPISGTASSATLILPLAVCLHPTTISTFCMLLPPLFPIRAPCSPSNFLTHFLLRTYC